MERGRFLWISLVVALFALNGMVFGADGWTEKKLIASDSDRANQFGNSVSIFRKQAIVGAYYDDQYGRGSGAAYVFEESRGEWNEEAKLLSSDEESHIYFGRSVSIYKNQAIVGAYGDNDNGLASGSAHIFEKIEGTWTEVAKLTASDGARWDYFGISVSIYEKSAVVGASENLGAGSGYERTGAAYIFEKIGGTWTEVAKLTASDGAWNDYFGCSVSMYENRIIVGAFSDDDDVENSGAAYIFEKFGGKWTEVAKLTASDGRANYRFGNSVSTYGEKVVVGTIGDVDNPSNSAYVFEKSGGVWNEVAKLTAGDASKRDRFGCSVSIFRSQAVVGTCPLDERPGAAYIFNKKGDAWVQYDKLTAGNGAVEDRFGVSVSMSPEQVIVGAPTDSSVGFRFGSAYIFKKNILSPVSGSIGVVDIAENCTAFYNNGSWCFNQHGTGAHAPGGGICSSDDTYSWDLNLDYPYFDFDDRKPVYSVASGQVAQNYAGCTNAGGTCGQVLVEHENGEGWSGYLHLDNIHVSTGQYVTENQILGYLSDTCSENNHLHFVFYNGQNLYGGLVSSDAHICERIVIMDENEKNCNNDPTCENHIQEGIDMADDCAVIKVHGGEYHENITIEKDIVAELFDDAPVVLDGAR